MMTDFHQHVNRNNTLTVCAACEGTQVDKVPNVCPEKQVLTSHSDEK